LSVFRPPLLDDVIALARMRTGALASARARMLIARGLAHPATPQTPEPTAAVTAVIPVYDDPDGLERTLRSLPDIPIVVVDDASTDATAIEQAITRSGARVRLHRSARNRGPGAARNRGVAMVSTPFIAFIDADCTAPPGWPHQSMHLFADPNVAAVAPRVRVDESAYGSAEWLVDALDMGPHPDVVRPDGRLTFVPSAALLMRTSDARTHPFDANRRLGEDVDLIWRLHQAGRVVRYDPTSVISHRPRPTTQAWLTRVAMYGSSAASLAEAFPEYPRPILPTAWSGAALLCVLLGRANLAPLPLLTSSALLAYRLRHHRGALAACVPLTLAVLHADLRSMSALIRREWWPVGMVAVIAAPRSAIARRALVLALIPIAEDAVRSGRHVDPVRYLGARLASDLAYGWGVTRSMVAARTLRPVWPRVSRRSDQRQQDR
jgi:mycofactocin system glycosyltransferase